MMDRQISSIDEVKHFLAETKFSGYQRVPLPYGLEVPGIDLGNIADEILDDRVRGRSVAEVGTYYGYFPFAAWQRGATEVWGVEPDDGRFAIARRISELHGEPYRIVQGTAETFEPERKFDVVLFLNVLHHVTDPVGAIVNLAKHCADEMIVEFVLTSDIGYMERKASKGLTRYLLHARAALIKQLTKGLPLVAVGYRKYHRTFYFSREAFENLFVTHLGIFESVKFRHTPRHPERVIAFCKMAR